ncbi:flagellar hook-associated protein FlgL [Ramlibacter tataouinensis]|uniref:flagellar hook-associated protein FlgL n=1 Tax=Ramlibacter tataouinensis TaxID=94132 RepID=UPI0022F3BB66|nr:flagellar hook-associated protein FlgL [Ramlibacter tataouinensis]WBY00605.1 flagellar hook-associated protein FlgL [Ramlibacter tataouinensis]
MRISTQSFYEQSQLAMNSQQGSLLRSQQKIGAMTRILTPADDPVGAARALGVSESLAVNAQYQATRGEAIHTLSLEENALQAVTGVLQDVKTLIVQAGNGVMTDADRRALATTLESAHAQLLGLANTDDGNGQYLFAGFRSGSPPFVRDAAGAVNYQGDQGQRLMQVDVSRQVAGTDDGRTLFQSVQGAAGYVTSEAGGNAGSAVYGAVSVMDAGDPLYGRDFSISFAGGNYTVETQDAPPVVVASGAFTAGVPIDFGGLQISIAGTPADGDVVEVRNARNAGTDVFATLSELVAALRAPLAGGGDAAQARLLNALSTANVRITNAHDNVLTVRSSVGSRLKELDILNGGGQARALMDKSHLSDLQDLDYASAITDFYQRQSALQATQQTFLRIQQISLLNLL